MVNILVNTLVNVLVKPLVNVLVKTLVKYNIFGKINENLYVSTCQYRLIYDSGQNIG